VSTSVQRFKKLNTDIENLVSEENQLTEPSLPSQSKNIIISNLHTNCLNSVSNTTGQVGSPHNFFGSNRNSIVKLLNIKDSSTEQTDSRELQVDNTLDDQYKINAQTNTPEDDQENEDQVHLNLLNVQNGGQNNLYRQIFQINMTESIKKNHALSKLPIDMTPKDGLANSLLLNNSELQWDDLKQQVQINYGQN
jgi:hypothetical protein